MSFLVSFNLTELHMNMGHLGRLNLQLMWDRFYGPKIEDDELHFVTKVRICVKKKKPHIVRVALIEPFSSAATLVVIALDFIHPATCSNGYQY